MADIICRVIPKPESGRIVFNQTTTKVPYFRDSGGQDRYLCGNCNFVLARDVTIDQIQNKIKTPDGEGLVVTCPECKSYNELGPDVG